jgi:hypothetical protein
MKRLHDAWERDSGRHLAGCDREISRQTVAHPEHLHEMSAIVGPQSDGLDLDTSNQPVVSCGGDDRSYALLADGNVVFNRIERSVSVGSVVVRVCRGQHG